MPFYVTNNAQTGNDALTHRVKVTIDSAKIDATLTGKDVIFDMSRLDSTFWSVVQSDGSDVRVTNAAGTRVPAFFEEFDGVGDAGWLILRLDTILSSTDTDYYVYCGNGSISQPAKSAAFGEEAVYDTGTKGRWSLHEIDTASEPHDSTGNDNTGTEQNMTDAGNQVAGTVGNCMDFNDGVDDEYIDCGNDASLQITGQAITIETLYWARTNATGAGNDRFIDKKINTSPYISYGMTRAGTSATVKFHIATGGVLNNAQSDDLTIQTWYHLMGTYDGANIKIYVNGVLKGTTPKTGNINGTSNPLLFGRNLTYPEEAFQGRLQEIKVVEAARNIEWAKASYENQLHETTFNKTIGATETTIGARSYPKII